jgi:hypothetical protein
MSSGSGVTLPISKIKYCLGVNYDSVTTGLYVYPWKGKEKSIEFCIDECLLHQNKNGVKSKLVSILTLDLVVWTLVNLVCLDYYI